MRVAIEDASLTLTSGRLARYTCELSLASARAYLEDEFYLTSDQAFAMPPDAPPNLRRGGGPLNSLERRWWLWGLSRELGRLSTDLIHGPDFSAPYIPARPSVLLPFFYFEAPFLQGAPKKTLCKNISVCPSGSSQMPEVPILRACRDFAQLIVIGRLVNETTSLIYKNHIAETR